MSERGLSRWVPDWKRAAGRAVGGAVGTALGLAVFGWPGGAVGGAVAGLVVALGVEYVVRLHNEVRQLEGIETTLEAERAQMAEERRLRDRQLELARREAAINAVDVEVYGGVVAEATSTGSVLPLSAILARRDVLLRARNLDQPLPPE